MSPVPGAVREAPVRTGSTDERSVLRGCAVRGRRLVVFDPAVDAEQHRGRSAVRRAVLAMTPDQPGASRVDLLAPETGAEEVFWGLLGDNDLTLVLRAAGFATAAQARRDAEALLSRRREMTAQCVAHRSPSLHSAWVTLDGRVVLVGGQLWRRSSSHADQVVLRAVRRRARWGPSSP